MITDHNFRQNSSANLVKEYDFKLLTCSPYYPQENGVLESGVLPEAV